MNKKDCVFPDPFGAATNYNHTAKFVLLFFFFLTQYSSRENDIFCYIFKCLQFLAETNRSVPNNWNTFLFNVSPRLTGGSTYDVMRKVANW